MSSAAGPSATERQPRQPWLLFFGKAALVLVPLYVAGHFAAQRYSIGIDPQAEVSVLTADGMAPRLMLIDKQDHDIERGDIVSLRMNRRAQELWQRTGITMRAAGLNKRVAGVAGDHVVVNVQGVFINGQQRARGLALTHTLRAHPSVFERELIVREGEYFLLGDVDSSFDSRYWGTARDDDLIGTATVLYAEARN